MYLEAYKLLLFVNLLRNDLGRVEYVGCQKVVLGSKVIDWEFDGLPSRLKDRVQKTLSNLKKYLGLP